jgi:hypothetical protein
MAEWCAENLRVINTPASEYVVLQLNTEVPSHLHGQVLEIPPTMTAALVGKLISIAYPSNRSATPRS